MPWNIRLACWIVDLLCPRVGTAMEYPSRCPDYVDEPELQWDEMSKDGDTMLWDRLHLEQCYKQR